MAHLSFLAKRQLEEALDMQQGYVLDFTNRTFREFFLDAVNIDIYSDKYEKGSNSKANRMRAFIERESNAVVVRLFECLLSDWNEYAVSNYPEGRRYHTLVKICSKLKENSNLIEGNDFSEIINDRSVQKIIQEINKSLNDQLPERVLDRLHTYTVKYFRYLCDKHNIPQDSKAPLHGLVGGYIKNLKVKGFLESEMTERILKSSIQIFESFNHVRNHKSFAHDNDLLNSKESSLIIDYILTTLKYIDRVEKEEGSDVPL